MNDDQERVGFEALAQSGADDADAGRALGARLKASHQASDLKALAALWIHGAVAAPETVPQVYDAVAEGYLGAPVGAAQVRTDTRSPPELIGRAFWRDLWALLDEPREGLGAANLTTRTAALAGQVSPHMQIRIAKAAKA
ncbi:MAG: hypothetical protein JSS35_20785, partial [Proteobacteria bacterium]|nr:hypothetical protein [Pseudomonadota bacterium]